MNNALTEPFRISDFGETATNDLLNNYLDEKLGAGCFREVYSIRDDDRHVLKVERGAGNFQNILEWEVWNRVRFTELSKWFAPCLNISPNGLWLTQARTVPVSVAELPDRIPSFFTDTKARNWGRLGRKGAIVCHDYGVNLLMEQGMTKRMKKAQWWE